MYKKVTMHHNPLLDELAAFFLMVSRGFKIFGVTEETALEFMTNADHQNPHADEVPDNLYLGCGIGSWANEHYLENYKDSSSCKIIAERLGAVSWPFVAEVTREDRNGAGDVKSHLALHIKNLYDMGWVTEEIYGWCKTAFIALTSMHYPQPFSMNTEDIAFSIERKFGEETATNWYSVIEESKSWDKNEYRKAMNIIANSPKEDFVQVKTYTGRTLKAYIPSRIQTNQRIGAAARSQGCEIILMQGRLDFDQVGIVFQQKHTAGLCFSLVLEELRKHELQNSGRMSDELKDKCHGEGTLDVCPVWHGHQCSDNQAKCPSIYCKSKSRPNSPGTIMDFDYIKDLFIETIIINPKTRMVVDINTFLNGSALLQRVS